MKIIIIVTFINAQGKIIDDWFVINKLLHFQEIKEIPDISMLFLPSLIMYNLYLSLNCSYHNTKIHCKISHQLFVSPLIAIHMYLSLL